MSPTERRARLIALMSQLEQEIAECQELASQDVLAYDEVEYLAIQLKFRRATLAGVEAMLSADVDSR